jgi:NhaP-type Na+/H+ and K+/H+ antiporter
LSISFTLQIILLLITSGLRGAIALTLALIVVLDHDIEADVRYLIAFHVSGIVLLTTLINGAITEWVYGKLNIDAPSKYDAELALSVLENLEINKIESTVAKLRKNWFCKFMRYLILQTMTRDGILFWVLSPTYQR